MGKKKILLIGDALDDQQAGVHTVVREVIVRLSSLRLSHLEFLLLRQSHDPETQLRQLVYPVPNFFRPVFLFWRKFVLIPRIAKKHDVDAVVEFAHFGPFNLPQSTRRITYIHDLTPMIHPEYHTAQSVWLHRLFLPRVIRKADLLFADSKHTATDIARKFPEISNQKKICVNHLAASDAFVPVREPDVLKKHSISEPYFLFTGTLEPRKGIDILLKAFDLFKADDKQHHRLVIVGAPGWKMPAMRDILKKYKYKEYVLYLGFVELIELVALYSHAKFLILPSRYEGFGLPIVEAMQCGTRSIVARNSSLEEIGYCCDALMFETDDVHQLAHWMKHGQTQFSPKKRLDWNQHVEIFIQKLEEIL